MSSFIRKWCGCLLKYREERINLSPTGFSTRGFIGITIISCGRPAHIPNSLSLYNLGGDKKLRAKDLTERERAIIVARDFLGQDVDIEKLMEEK
jgi:hypothetical protein